MIRFTYGFNFPVSLNEDEEYWWGFRSKMKAYKTLTENTPFGVGVLRSLHLQWININDYEVRYGFERIN